MNAPPEHIPFPRTNHLVLMPGVVKPDLKRLHPEELMQRILASPSVAEEKVDGSNLGITFDQDGELFLQGRTKYLNLTKKHPQHHLLMTWVWWKRDLLWEALGPGRTLFGEWMVARHTIKYVALPDWFVAFDVMERPDHEGEAIFWSADRRNELLERVGITPVPRVAVGPFSSLDQLLEMAEQPSPFGSEKREGLYLRLEEDGRLLARAKMVRPEFQKKHEEEDDWSRKFIREKNCLASDNASS